MRIRVERRSFSYVHALVACMRQCEVFAYSAQLSLYLGGPCRVTTLTMSPVVTGYRLERLEYFAKRAIRSLKIVRNRIEEPSVLGAVISVKLGSQRASVICLRRRRVMPGGAIVWEELPELTNRLADEIAG